MVLLLLKRLSYFITGKVEVLPLQQELDQQPVVVECGDFTLKIPQDSKCK